MIFSLLVYAAPHSHQAAESAYRFAVACLAQGHSIHRVFLYGDGIHGASALATPPLDEPNLPDRWQTLAQAHGLDLVVCIAAAVRRGVLDANEAHRYEKPGHNLHEGFELSGLGQLTEAAIVSDRMITFGA